MIVICACSLRPTETFCSTLLCCEHILGQWVPRKEPKSHSRIYSRPCGNIKNIRVTVGPRSLSAAMKTVIFSEPALISDSHEVTASLYSNVQSHFLLTLSDVMVLFTVRLPILSGITHNFRKSEFEKDTSSSLTPQHYHHNQPSCS